jgi:hypothetical protein
MLISGLRKVGENIGMGDPANASNIEKIREAASLGGSLDFIEKLPNGMDTRLTRIVDDESGGPFISKRKLNELVYGPGGRDKFKDTELSGGQMQRLFTCPSIQSLAP